VDRGVGIAVGVGVTRGFGTGVTRITGTTVTRGSNAEVEPRAVSVGALGDGNAVSPATSPVGVGSAVGDALEGAALGAGDAGAAGVGDAADALAPGAAEPVGVADGGAVAAPALELGCAAVSPPSEGPGVFGPPNAPTASAIPARTRFRIPRATTSRARWAIVTNDRHSSSGRAHGG
jgi:hypothetical protein